MFPNSDIQAIREKIDGLNREAWNARVNDSPKSFALSQESVELSRAVGYKKGLAHGLKSLGFCLIRITKNEEALPLLEESLSLFKSLGDLGGQAVVIGYKALIQRNRGDLSGALELSFKALALSQATEFTENIGTDFYQIGVTYKYLGDFEKALDYLFQSLSVFRKGGDRLLQSYPINVIGSIYFENGDYQKALECYGEGLTSRRESNDKLGEAGSLDNIGFSHFKLGNFSQAIDYCKQSLAISKSTGDQRAQSNALLHLAEIYKQVGDVEKATSLSNESLEIKKIIGDRRSEAEMLLFLSTLHTTKASERKALELLNEALKISEELKMVDLLSRTRYQLSEHYKRSGNYKEALKQMSLHINLEKEFHKNTVAQKVLTLEITHKAEEAKKEADTERLKNEELTKLNNEIEAQKKKLEIALADLKTTQAQLIQAEKMASLGELTAGIAHEIQNPLNFVNNFASVNRELLSEMKEEVEKGNLAEVKLIASDVEANEEKIVHHGQRADSIVKGMLQHARANSGEKQPTDINKLAEEYLRLSYQGMRAKDKTFNAVIETSFDETLGEVVVVPQDIGRVLLNLFNNAFYAVNQKKELLNGMYEPAVTVTTKKEGNNVTMRVRDNGTGMPEHVKSKVFQPFFTMKPTGEGTGLGLSLSYDIITKGHGGRLSVQSTEGEGSEFIVTLPA